MRKTPRLHPRRSRACLRVCVVAQSRTPMHFASVAGSEGQKEQEEEEEEEGTLEFELQQQFEFIREREGVCLFPRVLLRTRFCAVSCVVHAFAQCYAFRQHRLQAKKKKKGKTEEAATGAAEPSQTTAQRKEQDEVPCQLRKFRNTSSRGAGCTSGYSRRRA